MSVLKRDRSVSPMEYYYGAIQLRKNMTRWMLRNFGIKDKIRTIDFEAKLVHMDEHDTVLFHELMEKYNLGNKLESEYPEWIIDTFRRAIMNNLIALTKTITLAEAQTESYEEKYKLQDQAVGYCNNILQEMQYAMDVFDIDVQKYMPYVKQIEEEIKQIGLWKTRTKNLEEKENKKGKEQVFENFY